MAGVVEHDEVALGIVGPQELDESFLDVPVGPLPGDYPCFSVVVVDIT
jgi:hypothetical protein